MLLYWKHERIFKMLMWLIGAPIKKTKKTPFMPQYFTSSNIKKKKYWRCRWHQDILFYSQVWYYFLVKNATIADTNLLYWVLWLFFFFVFFFFFHIQHFAYYSILQSSSPSAPVTTVPNAPIILCPYYCYYYYYYYFYHYYYHYYFYYYYYYYYYY